MVVFKDNRIPYKLVLRDGFFVTETPAYHLPRHSVVAFRDERYSLDTNNFIEWSHFLISFVKDLTQNERKILLVYGAYRAYLSFRVLRNYNENVIVVYALPAHFSGKLKPLDVTVF